MLCTRNCVKKGKIAKNAGWLVGLQLVKSVLGVVISMLTARFLGPSDFGVINYAASIVSFVTPLMQLGFTGVLVQELVNSPEKEGEILGTSIALSGCASVACIVGVFLFAVTVNRGETETIIVCTLYSALLIFQALEMMVYWFQAKLLSKYSAVVSLTAYVVISVYKTFLLVTQKNIYWFAVSNALDHMLIAVGLIVVYGKLGGARLTFQGKIAKNLFSKSKYYILSNMMVTIFAQTDKVMLKLMIGDVATGYYSAAVSCAGMTGFVFAAIIDSFRPVIFDCKKHSEQQFEKNMVRLYGMVIYLSLLQSLVVSLASKWIVLILYGADYTPAIDPLRLIVWYTTFSYLGSVRNIWILAENKQQYLWSINLSGALINVVLNYWLIPIMGTMGAALASLITQIFTNVVTGFVIRSIRRTNLLMLQALDPREMVCALKHILQ